jgi:hypothetical protein
MAKTLEAKLSHRHGAGSEHAEALIASRTRELFDRLPPLLGFSFDQEFAGVDVELERWPGHAWRDEIYDEVEAFIAEFAAELAAQHPNGGELLRGRTFARNIH